MACRDRRLGHPFLEHREPEQPGDADAGRPGADEHDPRVGEPRAEAAQAGQHAGDHDRGGALDVVVEGRHAVPVAVEDAQRVVLLEVLPLDDAARPDLGHALDERLDQRVVGRPAQPRRPMAEVQRVGEQRRIVGPDVERDRQRSGPGGCRCRRVQRELADRDGHPAGALVAEAEDPLVVGDDDEPDVVVRALAQELRDPVAVGRRDPRAARPPDDVAELLARPPDRRRVDDRQELLEVLGERPGRTASRCGPGARPARCTARARRPCAAGARARGRSAPRSSGSRSGSSPRSRNASRSGSLKARSLVSSRLPRRAGPASAIDAGRPAAMASNGAGSGRIQARIPAGSAPPCRSEPRRPVTISVPTMPYASWPGRWQMYRYVPGVAKVTVVVRLEPAGMRDLGRARAVDRLGAGAVALVGRRVADDPFVVDRVVVAQHDRERHAGRHDQPVRLVVRVVDPRSRRSRPWSGSAPAQAAAIAGQPEREERGRRPGRRAPAGERWSSDADRSGHRQRRAPPRRAARSRRCRRRSARSRRRAGALSSVRSGATAAPGRSSPAMTRDGAPAPGRVDREVEASCGAAASMLTLVSQRRRRDPAHAAVRAQVVEQRLGRRRAVVEDQAVGPASGPAAAPGRRSVSR